MKNTEKVLYYCERKWQTRDVHNAAMLMTRHGVRRLPVVENEKLVGILSLKDLAKKRIFIAEIGHIIFEVSNRK